MDEVDVLVALAALAELEGTLEVLLIATASVSTSQGSSSVDALNGESRARRISFACARPIPRDRPLVAEEGVDLRRSRPRISARAAASRSRASGPRCARSSSIRSGAASHTPARFFLPPSVRMALRLR